MDTDTTHAIETNRNALLGVVKVLLALGAKSRFLSPLWGIEPAGCDQAILPRLLHRAALRILRPAEWAARRLVIALAQELKPPPAKPRPPKPRAGSSFVQNPYQTGIYIPPATRMAMRASGNPDTNHPVSGHPSKDPGFRPVAPLRPVALPLFDPPLRKTRCKAPAVVPRVTLLGAFERPSPFRPLLPPKKPSDPLDASRLGLRIVGLSLALEDLPRQALRYARWRETSRQRPAVRILHNGLKRFLRRAPLRRWLPRGGGRQPEVNHVLLLANGLARAAGGHDTS